MGYNQIDRFDREAMCEDVEMGRYLVVHLRLRKKRAFRTVMGSRSEMCYGSSDPAVVDVGAALSAHGIGMHSGNDVFVS